MIGEYVEVICMKYGIGNSQWQFWKVDKVRFQLGAELITRKKLDAIDFLKFW